MFWFVCEILWFRSFLVLSFGEVFIAHKGQEMEQAVVISERNNFSYVIM